MSRKDELLQALQNPNVRAFLDMLAEAEGVRHGYNTGFGNTDAHARDRVQIGSNGGD